MSKVFWISGGINDRKLALESTKSQFSGAEFIEVSGEFTVAYLEHVVTQKSCFNDNKVVIVKNMPKPTSTRQTLVNQLKKLIDNIPDNVYLIFYGISVVEEKAMSGHVQKKGTLIDFAETLDENDAMIYVSKIVKENGKSIDTDAAEFLISTCGHDKSLKGIGVNILRVLCDKLCFFLGKKKNADINDVMQISVPSQEFVIWKIFDALDNRDICSCYSFFYELEENEGSAITAANVLLSIALPRYRMLFYLKESVSNKISKDEIMRNISGLNKLSFTGKDWNIKLAESEEKSPAFTEFAIKTALNGFYNKKPTIEMYSRKDLLRISNALYAGVTEIRARGSSNISATLLIDSFFLSACSQIDDNTVVKLRESYNYE